MWLHPAWEYASHIETDTAQKLCTGWRRRKRLLRLSLYVANSSGPVQLFFLRAKIYCRYTDAVCTPCVEPEGAECWIDVLPSPFSDCWFTLNCAISRMAFFICICVCVVSLWELVKRTAPGGAHQVNSNLKLESTQIWLNQYPQETKTHKTNTVNSFQRIRTVVGFIKKNPLRTVHMCYEFSKQCSLLQ